MQPGKNGVGDMREGKENSQGGYKEKTEKNQRKQLNGKEWGSQREKEGDNLGFG